MTVPTRDQIEESLWWRWPIWRRWDALLTLWHHKLYLPHYYQRARYGYSYMDEWSMDYHISNVMSRYLAVCKHSGHPVELETMEEWEHILAQMKESFDLIISEEYSLELDLKKRRANQLKINRGLHLFAKHFQGLWD